MTRNVITFREDTPVEEIASTLTSKRITGAPVIANEGHVVGIVSETDVFSKRGKTARGDLAKHLETLWQSMGKPVPAGEEFRRLLGRIENRTKRFGLNGDSLHGAGSDPVTQTFAKTVVGTSPGRLRHLWLNLGPLRRVEGEARFEDHRRRAAPAAGELELLTVHPDRPMDERVLR